MQLYRHLKTSQNPQYKFYRCVDASHIKRVFLEAVVESPIFTAYLSVMHVLMSTRDVRLQAVFRLRKKWDVQSDCNKTLTWSNWNLSAFAKKKLLKGF